MLDKPGLKYFFFVVFGLLFAWGQAGAYANDLVIDGEIETAFAVISPGDLHQGSNLPNGLPFGSGETPVEQDEKDETEQKQKTDDHRDQLYSAIVHHPLSNLSAHRCLLSQITLALQNRPRILLFKLYHSWKGFIH